MDLADTISPVVNGTLSLFAGNFIGAIVDRLSSLITSRMMIVRNAQLGPVPTSLLEALAGVFLHAGMLGIGTSVATRALPFITEDSPSLALFLLGLFVTSPHLKRRLNDINKFVLVLPDGPRNREPEDVITEKSVASSALPNNADEPLKK